MCEGPLSAGKAKGVRPFKEHLHRRTEKEKSKSSSFGVSSLFFSWDKTNDRTEGEAQKREQKRRKHRSASRSGRRAGHPYGLPAVSQSVGLRRVDGRAGGGRHGWISTGDKEATLLDRHELLAT